MTRNEVCVQLVPIVAGILCVDADDCVAAARFVDDLGADSLDSYDLAEEIENSFCVAVSSDEVRLLATVGDACDFILGKLAASAESKPTT